MRVVFNGTFRPSGVGKGTVCEALLKENLDIKYSISQQQENVRQRKTEKTIFSILLKRV